MNDQEMIEDQVTDQLQDASQESHRLPKWPYKTTIKSSSKTKKQLLPLKHQQTIMDKHRQQQSHAKSYEIRPLILKGTGLSRVALNHLLINKLPNVKCNNIIHNDKTGKFTLYPTSITSFNILLNLIPINELPTTVKIFVPRSIQRIKKMDKEAFVKRVDKELTNSDIQNTLINEGYQIEHIERLMNKEKTGPGSAIKITFSDVKDRETFVRLGLQVDHLHFPAEKAKQRINPQRCHSCFRYGHIAKYCEQQQQQ